MLMKFAKEDISKIFARADITDSSWRLSAKKQKEVFYTVLSICKITLEHDCIHCSKKCIFKATVLVIYVNIKHITQEYCAFGILIFYNKISF